MAVLTASGRAVKAIITCDRKVLLQLRDEKEGIFHPGCWGLFGGEVDEDETPSDALCRELVEELSFWPTSIEFAFRWQDPTTETILRYYIVPLTVPNSKLRLREGKAMELFSDSSLLKLRTTPDLLIHASKISDILNNPNP